MMQSNKLDQSCYDDLLHFNDPDILEEALKLAEVIIDELTTTTTFDNV